MINSANGVKKFKINISNHKKIALTYYILSKAKGENTL